MNYNITNLRKRLCTGLPIWVGVGKGENRAAPPPLFLLISSLLFSSFFSRQPVKMVTKNLERGKEGQRGAGRGRGGDSTGKLYPSVLPLALLNTIFDRKRCSFVYLLLTKWYFFHVPSLEFCIPFNCCCVHTVFTLFREPSVKHLLYLESLTICTIWKVPWLRFIHLTYGLRYLDQMTSLARTFDLTVEKWNIIWSCPFYIPVCLSR